MTIASTARKAGPLLGNGSTTSFSFSFKVFATSDIKVAIANSAGVETVLVENTHYTVSLNANQETSPGGAITYPISGSPLPSGSVLSIIGDLDYDQPLDLPSGGNFNPTALENQLDRATMQIQQLKEQVDRSAKLPQTSAADAESLVADIIRLADSADNLDTVAGSITGVNTTATNIANVNTVAGSIANVNATGGSIANVNTVATNIASVNTNAANISAIQGAAANAVTATTKAAEAASSASEAFGYLQAYRATSYGALAADPVVDPNGNPPTVGDEYFNTSMNLLKRFNGVTWQASDIATADLAAPSGSALVGYDGGTVQAVLDEAKPMANYTALRAYTGRATGLRITQAGLAGFFQRDDADTISADNGGTIIVDASGRRWKRVFDGAVNVKWFGAVGDGVADDTAEIQSAIDYLPDGARLNFQGKFLINGTLYVSAKNQITLDFTSGELVQASASGFALLVHGGTLTRNLSTWPTEILEQPYESVTPCVGVKVRGFRSSAMTGKKASQVMFYFADDCEFDGVINGSNGSGVEFRQCARPKFGRIEVNGNTNYGLFVYQCHGLDGGTLVCNGSGRGYVIKQRHKLYPEASHAISRIVLRDIVGVDDPVWGSGGDSFKEIVAAGGTAAAQTNRNFAGHECVSQVSIGRIDLVVTPSASVSVTNPAVHIGAFASGWTIGEINFYNGNKAFSTTPLVIGSRGDIARGKADGGLFGENHIIHKVHFEDYNFTEAGSLINYGVSCAILSGSYKNVRTAKIIDQALAAFLPFDSVGFLEFRNQIGDITLSLGLVGEQGVRVMDETVRFVTGGNSLRFTPINRNSNTACAPWYVRSQQYYTIGTDSITVLSGGAGASDHVSTTGMGLSKATSGNINCRVSVTAPTSVTALFLASTTTRNVVLEPSTFEITGSPSGTKIGVSLTGEVTNMGGHAFVGTFGSTISDTTGGKNLQALRRTVYMTAAPTTGTWQSGDRVENIAPTIGQPKGWRCTAGGTPGTWVSEGNL